MFSVGRFTKTKIVINALVKNFTTSKICNSKPLTVGHKVNGLEKRFLVWTGKYKRIEEVPSFVPGDVVEKARNRMRIRIANIMMLATIVACFGMVISGKRARDRGETVEKQNLDWHKRYQEGTSNTK